MPSHDDARLTAALAHAVFPLAGEHRDYDALVEAAGAAQLVLLGAASHGTHEHHRERAQLTKRLIVEKGFTAVAVEADRADADRVQRFVQGRSGDADAVDALDGFRRFPQWMWRNADVLDFVGWLRAHNDALPDRGREVGFYGLDLYRPSPSMAAVFERGTHMADTLDALVHQLARRGPAKIVVWAHNAHAGDARATQMSARGERNLGQLCRERRSGVLLDGLGGLVLSVGFTTHHGSVSAASSWGAPVERKGLRPALDGSYEQLFHGVGIERFLLDLRMLGGALAELERPRLERAIGVIYRPQSEHSHYFAASLPRQFDFVLHFDETRAVEPLERTGRWDAGELPDTHPSAR